MSAAHIEIMGDILSEMKLKEYIEIININMGKDSSVSFKFLGEKFIDDFEAIMKDKIA